MYEYLDRRYALALYEVAEEKGKILEYLEDLQEICNIIYGSEEFYQLIKHPQISTVRKKETFRNVFEGKIDNELLSFLLILIEKDRILYLREKLKQMEEIYLKRINRTYAHVKSVVPLNEEQVEKLTKKLENKFNTQIILDQQIDKSIIGGLYIRVGDHIIDDTIKSKLDEMKSMMLRKE